MNKNLCSKVDEIDQDNLIAKLYPPATTFGIRIPGGTGILARGTVLAMADDGTYSVLGASGGSSNEAEGSDAETGAAGVAQQSQADAAASSGAAANCILADPVDATDEDVVTAAYRTGNFNRCALIVADGYTMTLADEEELRKRGIFLTDMAE